MPLPRRLEVSEGECPPPHQPRLAELNRLEFVFVYHDGNHRAVGRAALLHSSVPNQPRPVEVVATIASTPSLCTFDHDSSGSVFGISWPRLEENALHVSRRPLPSDQ
jgi:hypothetical protein